MPFKKNSPGCLCCQSNVWAYGRGGLGTLGPAYFTQEDNNGGIELANNTGKDPNLYDIIGVNIDDKYFLVRHLDTGEIRQFNPSNRSDVGVLWGAGTDIAIFIAASFALGGTNGSAGQLYYSSTWGMGYGLYKDTTYIAGTTEAQAAFSVDSSGSFVKGPYQIGQQGTFTLTHLTMKENGDLYLHGPQRFDSGFDYAAFYVNEDMEYPILSANHTFKTTNPTFRYSPDPDRAYFGLTSIFCDGTTLYVYLSPGASSGTDYTYQEGIYELSESGDLTFITTLQTIHPEFEEDTTLAPGTGIIHSGIYTPSQERWQCGIFLTQFIGWWAWFDLPFTPNKYMHHYMGEQWSTGVKYYGSHALMIRPLDIEDYWDAL